MDLKRCNNGHFYDGDSYSSCPHCAGGAGNPMNPFENQGFQDDYNNSVTEKLDSFDVYKDNGSNIDQQEDTVSLGDLVNDSLNSGKINTSFGEENDDQGITVGFYENSIGSEPVVGWLVCVEGNHFGEDFKLRAGRNFIGRSTNMDICLSGDKSVSRERHLIVLYDPNNNIFIVQAGDSKELSYHNEELVLSPVELKPYDVLKVGSTKLLFIPFCSDRFTWKIVEED